MRRYQLFAAGVSVALLLGAGTPALAKSDKAAAGKGHSPKTAPGQTKVKPNPKPHAPKTKHGVQGGGVTADGAEFSVMVREDHKHGHFNYTSKDLKVRCKGLDGANYDQVTYVAAGGDPGGTVKAKCVRMDGKTRAPIYVEATFWDRAKKADDATVTPAADPTAKKDGATINFYSDELHTTAVAATAGDIDGDSGDLKSGDVRVR